MAHDLASVCRSLTGRRTSEGLIAFFGLGGMSEDSVTVAPAVDDAGPPAQLSHAGKPDVS